MKNKGLLMIVLLLSFCCVLTGYALTEGSTEQLEIDADEIVNVICLSQGNEVRILQMDHWEDIDRIVEALNHLELRPAAFKISAANKDIETMTFLVLMRDELSAKQPVQIALFSGDRVLVSEGASNLCYEANTQPFVQFVGAYINEVAKNYPSSYAGMGFWINLPDELLE